MSADDSGSDPATSGCPIDPSRRVVLRGGLAVASSAVAAAGLAGCRDERVARGHALGSTSISQSQPFHGLHQSGIITPTQAAAIAVAFDVVGEGRARLQPMLRKLTERISFLMVGGRMAQRDPKLPPYNSGLLGDDIFPDNLTVTVSIGASLFDQRFGLAAHKPRHLVEMLSFPNDALNAELCDGDVLLQICSNTAETNLHALRDIIKATSGVLNLRWMLEGFLPPHTVQQLGHDSVINLLGFKDGTANPDANSAEKMDEIVWVQANSGEPAWATGGSYQAVRIIRNFVEFWDRTPLQEQERIMGRHKASGAPLGKQREHDPVDFSADPTGAVTPLNAHIRLANPRVPGTRQILRRSFNYSSGFTRAGQLNQGLLFICYQSNLAEGFIAIQRRLDGEPLEEYIKPVGGGFFYALPGVRNASGYLGQGLLDAAAQA